MKKLIFILILFLIIAIGLYIFLQPSEKEFAEEDLYSQIIERGVIKIGVNPESKPFAFYDENGNLQGFDIDLSRYIAQYILKNPDKIEFIPINASNRLIKASTGEVDIVISTVTITPHRQEIIDFSIPYDNAGQAILVHKNSHIKVLSDLAEQNVGVIFGTTAEKNIKILVPTSHIMGFHTYQEAYVALKNNRIDAITSDDTILSRFASNDKSIKLLPKRYSREPYGIAFKKSHSTVKLKENLNYAIKDMQNKNVITRLRKKWNIGV